MVQFNYLPTIHAQLALSHNNSSQSIEALQATAPYDLGTEGAAGGGAFMPALHPVYVRGEAYLAAHQGNEAAVEFQKILDHRGVVLYEPIGAFASILKLSVSCLSWNWRGRSSVKITERTHEKRAKTLHRRREGLRAAVRFRDSISLQRTVQAEMYPERAGQGPTAQRLSQV